MPREAAISAEPSRLDLHVAVTELTVPLSAVTVPVPLAGVTPVTQPPGVADDAAESRTVVAVAARTRGQASAHAASPSG
ncbi:hypothetical protein [Streptomyces sp. NPDC008139]|uniref:hypothetical protein n=1 Tax=Streptomyces sp. NPDC008139 TaxID=3364814 RepID=UPI0036E63274